MNFTYETCSDLELAILSKENREALSCLLSRYAPLLKKYARKFSHFADSESGQDYYQECCLFLISLIRKDSFVPEKIAYLPGYFKTALINELARKQKKIRNDLTFQESLKESDSLFPSIQTELYEEKFEFSGHETAFLLNRLDGELSDLEQKMFASILKKENVKDCADRFHLKPMQVYYQRKKIRNKAVKLMTEITAGTAKIEVLPGRFSEEAAEALLSA